MAAIISAFFVRPGKEYLEYIDFPVIALLFCLMFVVSGMIKANLFNVMSSKMLKTASDSRKIAVVLINVTYFSAMFITNDVALITLVPFTTGIFSGRHNKNLIPIVVLETVAANLGSMLMPFGNPQNLYLYSYYEMSAGKFILTVLPLGIISLILINTAVGSYEAVPAGLSAIDIMGSCGFVIDLFTSVFLLALRLALPYVAAEFVLELSLGILMKLIPQIHVFVIQMQGKIILGLILLLALSIPMTNFIDNYITKMLDSMNQALGSLVVR